MMSRAITRVGLTRLSVPLKEPHPTASGDRSERPTILVAVETGDGLVGVGECSPPLELATDERLDRCWDDLAHRIVPSLLGRSIDDRDVIATLSTAWSECDRSAAAGAETACWDLLGQQTHQSLAELLGASEARIEVGVESGFSVGSLSDGRGPGPGDRAAPGRRLSPAHAGDRAGAGPGVRRGGAPALSRSWCWRSTRAGGLAASTRRSSVGWTKSCR